MLLTEEKSKIIICDICHGIAFIVIYEEKKLFRFRTVQEFMSEKRQS